MGSFVTFLSYTLILANAIQLSIAFRDGSKQDESTQMIDLDRFLPENAVNLGDYNFDMKAFLMPPLPPKIGRVKLVHTKSECSSGD